MNFKNLFQGKSDFIAVTTLKGDDLFVYLLKKSGSGHQLVEQQTVSIAHTDATTQDSVARFRNQLSSIRARSPQWIHLILRNVSFVKVFNLIDVTPENQEEIVSKRIRSEIPYLADEVMLHQIVEEGKEPKSVQVSVFGISKNVLQDQIKKLEAFGILPERVFLSTEALRWFYRERILPVEKMDFLSLLIHQFTDQVELLFFEGSRMLQSRWVEKSSEPAVGLRDAVDASLVSFQREWHQKPNEALLVGMGPNEAQSFVVDPAIRVRALSDELSEKKIGTPVLLAAVLEGFEHDSLFDFTLETAKQLRDQQGEKKEWNRVAVSVGAVSLAILFLATIQVLIAIMQIGWYEARMRLLSSSVSEVKQLRKEALAILDFQTKKLIPVILIVELRKAISDKILLNDLDYDQKDKVVAIKGTATAQADVDGFLNSLEKSPFFEHLSLEQVQADHADRGGYSFSIKGSLKVGARNEV